MPDAFVQSGLERWLRVRGVDRLAIVGVSANTVECTARSAGNLGFNILRADATFTFAKTDFNGVLRSADDVHAMALANLQGEYATVLDSAELKAQLLSRA